MLRFVFLHNPFKIMKTLFYGRKYYIYIFDSIYLMEFGDYQQLFITYSINDSILILYIFCIEFQKFLQSNITLFNLSMKLLIQTQEY